MKTVLLVCVGLLAACNRVAPTVSGMLPQRGYLWQRDWTPAVIESLAEAKKRMDGAVILGAEILWRGRKPEVVRVNIDWKMLKSHGVPCGVALRIAPYPGPFSAHDATAWFIASRRDHLSILRQLMESS
jgi:hypothetical protein